MTIWSAPELKGYIQEGYDALVLATGCLWATEVFPDYAYAFNYTSAFEREYFQAGDRISGLAQFTSEFERDYLDNAQGPANHNYHWEQNDGLVETSLPAALAGLPEDLHEIERACWNTQRVDALRSRDLETDDTRYELNRGQVQAYTQDKDGLRRLRKWRVPSAPYVPYALDDDNEYWGVLVQIPDVSTDTPIGTWGDFVQVPGEHLAGDPWGVIVGIYTEPNNLRMEYRRRGTPLDDDFAFEIPERYRKYVRHYALARAFERDGDGQDLELATHYQARYEAGVQRMLKRKQAVQYQRAFVMGGSPSIRGRNPRVRLPWNYGSVVR